MAFHNVHPFHLQKGICTSPRFSPPHTPATNSVRIPARIFVHVALPFNDAGLRCGALSRPPPFSSEPPLRLKTTRSWNGCISFPVNSGGNLCHLGIKDNRTVVSAIEGGDFGADARRTRKVVEHICLVKAKKELSEVQEKDMLDYIYTVQYHMRGVVAVSLGRISDKNPEGYTHAIFIRFQTKEDLAKFYCNSFYVGVLKEHVMPYCHGLINLDYESEVEDDILPIFRKGEEFNYGVELILLVEFIRSSLGGSADDAMTSLAHVAMKFPSLIVQITKGPNMNMSNTEYTHGAVLRFPSYDALEIFTNSSEYKIMWKSKFEPIIQKATSVQFSVDPIGTELM